MTRPRHPGDLPRGERMHFVVQQLHQPARSRRSIGTAPPPVGRQARGRRGAFAVRPQSGPRPLGRGLKTYRKSSHAESCYATSRVAFSSCSWNWATTGSFA